MRSEDFLSAAADLIGPEVRIAASALLELEIETGERAPPQTCVLAARALGAPELPVLHLLGWVRSRRHRANRHVYVDLLDEDAPLSEAWVDLRDLQARAALAVMRSMGGRRGALRASS